MSVGTIILIIAGLFFGFDPSVILQGGDPSSQVAPAPGPAPSKVDDEMGKFVSAVMGITGGNFLRHEAIRHFEHSCAGDMSNADLAHDRGFFVGNQARDLQPQIERFCEVLGDAAG